MTLAQKIKRLSNEVSLLSGLLDDNAEMLLGMSDDNELLASELTQNGERTGLTAGFVLRALLVAQARIHRCRRTLSSLWRIPNSNGQLPPETSIEALPDPPGTGTFRQLMQRVQHERLGSVLYTRSGVLPEWHPNNNEPLATQLFDFLAQMWLDMAFLSESQIANSASVIMQFGSRSLIDPVQRLERAEAQRLRTAMRSLVAREGLFEWADEGNRENPDREPAYRFRRILDSVFSNDETGSKPLFKHIDIEDFFPEEAFAEGDINREDLHRAVEIFRRLADMISGSGDLKDAMRDIHDAQVLSGSPGFNVIPPEHGEPGECMPILVAFATGLSGRKGLREVLRQVREHLITCGDSHCGGNGPTRIVMLFTDSWDPRIIRESQGELMAHEMHRQVPKMFIGALFNGKALVPVSLSH